MSNEVYKAPPGSKLEKFRDFAVIKNIVSSVTILLFCHNLSFAKKGRRPMGYNARTVKMRRYILVALAAAGIGLGGTFGASAAPINGSILGATVPAPELHKAYYYRQACRGYYSGRHKNRGYYDCRGYRYYYGGYPSYYYGYPGNFYRRYWYPGYSRYWW